MYLAIDEKQIGKGYGSKILKDLSKEYGTIILSVERPNKHLDDNRKMRIVKLLFNHLHIHYFQKVGRERNL